MLFPVSKVKIPDDDVGRKTCATILKNRLVAAEFLYAVKDADNVIVTVWRIAPSKVVYVSCIPVEYTECRGNHGGEYEARYLDHYVVKEITFHEEAGLVHSLPRDFCEKYMKVYPGSELGKLLARIIEKYLIDPADETVNAFAYYLIT